MPVWAGVWRASLGRGVACQSGPGCGVPGLSELQHGIAGLRGGMSGLSELQPGMPVWAGGWHESLGRAAAWHARPDWTGVWHARFVWAGLGLQHGIAVLGWGVACLLARMGCSMACRACLGRGVACLCCSVALLGWGGVGLGLGLGHTCLGWGIAVALVGHASGPQRLVQGGTGGRRRQAPRLVQGGTGGRRRQAPREWSRVGPAPWTGPGWGRRPAPAGPQKMVQGGTGPRRAPPTTPPSPAR